MTEGQTDTPATQAIATAVFHDAAMARWFIVTQQDWPAPERPEPAELGWGCLGGVDALIVRKVVVFRTIDSRSGRLTIAPELSAHGVGVRATVTFGRGR